MPRALKKSNASSPEPIARPEPSASRLVPALLAWFDKNARDLPWRRTRHPYGIWVSEIMLQQTQVKTVLPYWERWMRELPTIAALAEARPDTIHKLWEGLGYYTRVRNLQKAARQIVAEHGGRFPQDFEAILDLPGVGRYTAGAIASIAFNEPQPILDGNVIRVLARVFGIEGNPKDKTVNKQLWALAAQLVGTASKQSAENSCSQFNQSLMELGALVCTPRQPKCPECPVRKWCEAHRTNRVGELPNLGRRPKTTSRHFIAFVIEHNGRFLVRQRPRGVVNAHLWEFPNVELNGEFDVKASAGNALGFAPSSLEALSVVKHSITRYRITLEAWRGKARRVAIKIPTGSRWLKLEGLDALAWTSAHRKILERHIQHPTATS